MEELKTRPLTLLVSTNAEIGLASLFRKALPAQGEDVCVQHHVRPLLGESRLTGDSVSHGLPPIERACFGMMRPEERSITRIIWILDARGTGSVDTPYRHLLEQIPLVELAFLKAARQQPLNAAHGIRLTIVSYQRGDQPAELTSERNWKRLMYQFAFGIAEMLDGRCRIERIPERGRILHLEVNQSLNLDDEEEFMGPVNVDKMLRIREGYRDRRGNDLGPERVWVV